jgi:hypothetical protein
MLAEGDAMELTELDRREWFRQHRPGAPWQTP